MEKFSLFTFWCAALFATEFPEVVDFRNFQSFEKILIEEDVHSWRWTLANSAFEIGYTAFNDSPEIGTFLTHLKSDYQLEAVVEMGISLGSIARYFSSSYDEVHAIETSELLYKTAQERLAHCLHIHCHLGSSEEVLKKILPSLADKRILFYIDAHERGLSPLVTELEEIGKTHRDNCVIVIDGVKVPNADQDLLNKVFSRFSFHYLIPRNPSRPAKFVAIPQKWEKGVYWKAGKVDVLSGFNIYDFPIKLKNIADAGYRIQMRYQYPYGENCSPWDCDLQKIIVFGWTLDPKVLLNLPREKLLFFNMEPQPFPPEYYDYFLRVYTCCDDLVDGVKFFKLYYPYLMPMREVLPPFKEKKFCVMISGSDNTYPERRNELYSERMKMVEFFETKPPGEFDLYGRYWVKRQYRDFRGAIPGDHSGEEKISTLKNYRFCICFENTKDLNGYITEKIFACFAAGCVPVYWGAGNVETYIPKGCFIDYRDFEDREALYQYMKAMPKGIYEQYLENIRTFLNSEKAKLFSPEFFEKTIYEAISQ